MTAPRIGGSRLAALLIGLAVSGPGLAAVAPSTAPPVTPLSALGAVPRDEVCREVMLESFARLLGATIDESDDELQDERLAQTVAIVMLLQLFQTSAGAAVPSANPSSHVAPYLAPARFVETHAVCSDVGIGLLQSLDEQRSARTRAVAGDEVGQALQHIVGRSAETPGGPLPRLMRAVQRLPAVLEALR